MAPSSTARLACLSDLQPARLSATCVRSGSEEKGSLGMRLLCLTRSRATSYVLIKHMAPSCRHDALPTGGRRPPAACRSASTRRGPGGCGRRRLHTVLSLAGGRAEVSEYKESDAAARRLEGTPEAGGLALRRRPAAAVILLTDMRRQRRS